MGDAPDLAQVRQRNRRPFHRFTSIVGVVVAKVAACVEDAVARGDDGPDLFTERVNGAKNAVVPMEDETAGMQAKCKHELLFSLFFSP